MIETITDFYGRVIGRIETMSNGDKKVTNFNGVVLGYYRKSYNHTTNFNGVVLYKGDMASALLVLVK